MIEKESMPEETQPVAIFGAGSWGTALAIAFAHNDVPVILWGRDPGMLQQMSESRVNERYLPGHTLPDLIRIVPDFQQAIKAASDILLAIPSHGFRDTLTMLSPHWSPKKRLLWVTKGIDPDSNQLLHQVADHILGIGIKKAIISGPSFAKEVAKGLPTAVAVASTHIDFAEEIAQKLSSEVLRMYTNDDIIGVQVGGAVKNVLAIATGISDALGYGANARSALITRGLVEMMRLGSAMGAKSATFTGLTGLGDLVLTCTDDLSRNRRFGFALGKMKTMNDAKQEIGQVVEGIKTAEQIYHLMQKYQVEMPICEQIYYILAGDVKVEQAVANLLHRSLKSEFLV